MSKSIEIGSAFQGLDKSSAWISIIGGLAASGELSPERLAEMGGDIRVRTLCVHAANLAANFHAEFVKVNGKNPS